MGTQLTAKAVSWTAQTADDSRYLTFAWPFGTVREGIFDRFLEVFWIFLKNEHGKVKGTPNGECRENQALCVGQVSIELI